MGLTSRYRETEMTAQATVTSAPGRARPFEKTQGATPGWLKRVIGRQLAPTREEYQAVLSGLWVGDPPMDALMDWMDQAGPQRARALYEQVLTEGLKAVPDCPEPLYQLIKSLERPPAWVDFELIDEGARFIQSTGMAAPYVLRDLALMGGYLLSGFNQSLVLTGALSQGTARRVAQTGKWWIDCTEEGGLKRFAEGFQGTLRVRLIHALVRRHLRAKEAWDESHWGLPLSQIDMVSTYLGFCVVMLGGLRKMGIPVTGRESRAVMHLWKYAGWLMGVQAPWLVDSEREGIVLLHHTVLTQSRPDWTSEELGKALSREPLERHFRFARPWRRRWAYRVHLSVTRYFLDRNKMRQLGLPEGVLPWYPLLTLVPRFLGYALQRYVPGPRAWQWRRGRRAQRRSLMRMFGAERAHEPAVREKGSH